MFPDLLFRSLRRLRRDRYLLWLGLGMNLGALFGSGWRLWLTQVLAFDFSPFADLTSAESFLFGPELANIQQLLWQGLLLGLGQFVVVWLAALVAEAGLVAAVSRPNPQAVTLRQALRWGRAWLGRFLAIDLLVFFPWFLIALILLLGILILAIVLAGFATSNTAASIILASTGLGFTCLLLLGGLLLPVGMVSLWFRLLAFREAILHKLAPKTAVRQTWRRLRQHPGDIVVLIIFLWGGQTVLLGALGFLTAPLLTWLASLTASATIGLQLAAWLATVSLTVLVWLLRGAIVAVTAVAWTLAYQNLAGDKDPA